MWNYTKCTSKDRMERLDELEVVFQFEEDCLKYLSEVQSYINSIQTTLVLLQDLEANILIEMDYAPVNNYMFHVVSIEDNGIKRQGPPCNGIRHAIELFLLEAAAKRK